MCFIMPLFILSKESYYLDKRLLRFIQDGLKVFSMQENGSTLDLHMKGLFEQWPGYGSLQYACDICMGNGI